MADNLENARLVVSLEARIRNYERALERAQKQTNARMAGIEAALKRPEAAMNRLGNSAAKFEKRFSAIGASMKGIAGGFLAGVSVNGAQKLIDAATRIQNALKSAGLEGAELSKVYDKLFQSAQRNGAPIEAMVSLYSKLALAQKELGISSDQIVGFADKVGVALRASGTSAGEASGALLQLGQAMGAGVVRAEEYNSILEGAPGIIQAAAAGLKEAGGSVAALRKLVNDGAVSSRAFFDAFIAGSGTMEERVAGAETTISTAFVRLQNVLIDVAGKFSESTGVSKTLADFMSGPLTQAIQELGEVFAGLGEGPISSFIGWMNAAVEAAVQGAADIGAALGTDQIGRAFGAKPYVGPRRIQSRIDDAFAGLDVPKQGRLELDVNRGKVEPVSLKDYAVPGKTGGGRSKAISEAEREAKKTRELIKELEEEKRLVGAGDLERRRAAESRRLGANATAEEKARVDELVRAITAEEAALKRAQEQREAYAQAGEFMIDSIGDALGSIADGSTKASDALKKLAIDLGVAVLKASLLNTGPLAGIFSGGGSGIGGILGGLFGGGSGFIPAGVAGPWGASIFHDGGTAGGPAPKRMVSPAVFAGAKRYHTGNLRPGEVAAILEQGETILQQAESRKLFESYGRMAQATKESHGGAGGQSTVELRLSPDLEARILEQAGRQSVRIVKDYDQSTLPGSVARIRNDPYRRG